MVLAHFEKEVEFEGLRKDGFLSPSRRACSAGFGAFRENEVHILYCAGGKIGEVTGVFLAEEHSSNADSEAPDTVPVRPVSR